MSDILGDWVMRRGDRLPLLSVILEDDRGVPVDLTGARVFLVLHTEDATPVFDPGSDDGRWEAEAFVYSPLAGVVVYDWPNVQTATLTAGVNELTFRVERPDGSHLTVPSERDARLVIRPAVLPPSVR